MGTLDFDKINEFVEQGYISVQQHPEFNLRIYNYAPKAQFDNFWTDEIMSCRGLIADSHNKIIARPFKKNFNIEQHDTLPNELFDVYEKLDGSLGVLYFANGKPRISTRGSFVSEQAIKANQILENRYNHVKLDGRLTYLFEIIYPENRIVVDYGGLEDLFLLAIIDTESGNDLALQDIGFPMVKKYDGIKDLKRIQNLAESNKEGFVIRFRNGLRIKVKFEEYKRLHKLLTGISPKNIWECMKSESGIAPLIERVPDEFYDWVKEIEADLLKQYSEIENKCQQDFKDLGDRKENALYFQTCDYPSILFSILDGKDYSKHIWKQIKPSGDYHFRCDYNKTKT